MVGQFVHTMYIYGMFQLLSYSLSQYLLWIIVVFRIQCSVDKHSFSVGLVIEQKLLSHHHFPLTVS